MSYKPWRVCRFQLPGAALAAPALGVALLVGCSKPEPAPEPVRAVKLVTVGTSAYGTDLAFAGEVRPRIETRLGFRVAGKIVRRQAELGQTVRVGQVLAELDAQDLRLAADAARAQVAAATTNRDLASADLKRYQELRAQNFISGAELERRESSYKAAQAQLDQAQAQLSAQGNQAGYARLIADVAGVVTGIEAEPGQVVSAGQPVVRVAQSGVRDVVFAVPEDRVRAVKVGSPVQVRQWNSDTVLAGRIREVAASADAATRTFQVKVSLETASPPPLGTTVSVVPQSMSLAGAPVMKLPTSALKRDAAGTTSVWVLDEASMTVKSVPVVVATADGNDVVVASGVQPGTQVVAAGVHVLSPGQKVTVYQPRVGSGQADAPAAAASATR
ncbi:efflux RND transporter periplasmic adaptor subunit [Pseudorhodoferax sp. Leaf267]|uniref:efflux RND transporter periplasmic adaptor subunit n=1 Tax=Pseudorhodoferax sp. Leaf267 TaxID=1736316 RepID=UPI0006FBBDB4|nr:efflux RND transporter periplasmic adaptor subunit [Pseudorhodoferax sp. Leaf267]KQP22652.1 RND transporter [Pseudorhodoferax sp. Leaf267]